MPLPLIAYVAGAGALGVAGLILTKKKKVPPELAKKATAEVGQARDPSSINKAIVATVPAAAPPRKNADGTVSAGELARSLQAEKLRASQLSDAQLKAIDDTAVPGQTVAPFDPNMNAGEGGTPMPLGTFKPGDIIPTDRVSISIKGASLRVPSGVRGDVLIRATGFNTDVAIRGVSIDPRFPDPVERDFPLSAVTGVGPVVF